MVQRQTTLQPSWQLYKVHIAHLVTFEEQKTLLASQYNI